MLNILYLPKDYDIKNSNLDIYDEYITYNDSIDEDRINLIYGYTNIKKIIPNFKIDFNDNKISKNIYWCHSLDESLQSHRNFLNEFIFNLPDIFVSMYDMVHVEIDERYILSELIFERVYVNKKFVFFGVIGKNIYVANLSQWHYFMVDVKEIIESVKTKVKGEFIHDREGHIYDKYFELFDSYSTDRIISVLGK